MYLPTIAILTALLNPSHFSARPTRHPGPPSHTSGPCQQQLKSECPSSQWDCKVRGLLQRLTCEVHVVVAAKAQDVTDGLVRALGLHHDGDMPDVGHVAHIQHMSWSHLAEQRLQQQPPTFFNLKELQIALLQALSSAISQIHIKVQGGAAIAC